MSQPNWNEDDFDLTLSQRTEELYRIPNMEPNADGIVESAFLPLRDMVIFRRRVCRDLSVCYASVVVLLVSLVK